MSILIEALLELGAPYVPGRHADVSTVDGWEVVKSGHGLQRNTERGAEAIIDDLIARIIKRLKSPVQRITRTAEYIFFSKSLNRGAICNVDFTIPQLRIITILPPGKDYGNPGTRPVIIEGVQYEMIEID